VDPRYTGGGVIFIATNGGTRKSTGGGATWAPKTDPVDSLSMGAVTLDAANRIDLASSRFLGPAWSEEFGIFGPRRRSGSRYGRADSREHRSRTR